MRTQFDSNTFEHDYIVDVLMAYERELDTGKPGLAITDKYACQLTAFMNGQVVQAVRAATDISRRGGAAADAQRLQVGERKEWPSR